MNEVGEATTEICSKAQLLIQSANYENGNLNIILYNGGEYPLKDFLFKVTNSDRIMSEKEESFEIAAGGTHTFSFETGSNIQEVIAQSKLCRGTMDRVGKNDVRGLI